MNVLLHIEQILKRDVHPPSPRITIPHKLL